MPKNRSDNIRYRLKIRRDAKSDKGYQRDLWNASKRDMLFWVNTFALIYEPRLPAVLPFLTHHYQDEFFLAIHDSIGKRDVQVPKSRAMGVSWMTLTAFAWYFIFQPYSSFLCISRTEDEVDKSEDTDTLFWKLDFLFEHLPGWMRPPIERRKLFFGNNANGSQIAGRSTTGNTGRGGRRLAVFTDEKAALGVDESYKLDASLLSVTHCKIDVSTPQGAVGSFYDLCHKPESEATRLWLHWSEHPEFRLGLYTSVDGQLVKLDHDYSYPADYEFVLDNKLRSPWYDREEKRYPHSKLVAQEVDIDFLGSAFLLFDPPIIASYRAKFEQRETLRGELKFDLQAETPKIEWQENRSNGRLLLWRNLPVSGNPPATWDVVVGADIAVGINGVKSSRSVLSLWDKQTKEKIGEFKTSDMEPHEFAAYAVALCKWMNGAFLIWEHNGPGKQFAKNVLQKLNYRNIYYKRNENTKDRKETDQPGWWSDDKTKLVLLTEYARKLSMQEVVNPSREGLDECLEYVYDPTGRRVYHSKSLGGIDPTGLGENHGDIVIADALGVMGLDERPVKAEKPKAKIRKGTYAHRQQMRRDARKPKREMELVGW